MNFELNQKLDQDLEQFVCRFLENNGADLEIHNKGIEALLPKNLMTLLETAEHISIEYGSDSGSGPDSYPDPAERYSINYGSKLLERMVGAVCGRTPFLSCQLEFDYLKSQGFDKLIREELKFFGSTGKVENWAEVKTKYLLITCWYMAQSDEQKQGLINLQFNLETGAQVTKMADMLSLVARNYNTDTKKDFLGDDQIKEIIKWVKTQAKEVVAREITPFQESMTRRFKRDIGNLEQYYDGLKREMEKSLERPGLSDQLIKERREKIALLPAEFKRKGDDLFKKYSIRVKVKPATAILIRTPAIKILYKTSVGRKIKHLSLIYNPVTKSIDPLVCQGCGKSITSIKFCTKLHLLCPLCANKCPVC